MDSIVKGGGGGDFIVVDKNIYHLLKPNSLV